MANRRRGKPAHRDPFDPLDGTIDTTFDLHGLTASQARTAVESYLATARGRYPGGLVHLITGKGRRSNGEPVLKHIVQNLLQAQTLHPVHAWGPDLDGGGYLVRLKP
jgi:DNA-nicking Smr family endonuclease